MTIASTNTKDQHNGNGSATSFNYNFKILDQSHLEVTKTSTAGVDTVLTITTHYTVSGVGADSGSITYPVTGDALATGEKLTIRRKQDFLQATDLQNQGGFFAEVHETAFDKQTMFALQNEEESARGLRAPVTDPTSINMTLPTKTARLGTVLGFNATSGDPEAGPEIADVSTLAAITADIATLADIEDGTDATDAIQAVAAKATEVGRLGTAAAVADLAILGTADVVVDMNVLATADIVADMNTLATSDVVADMNTLATSDVVSDMNTLATSDIVTDMNLLATSANVTAMGLLGTSANVTAMGLLGVSGVITDMGLLGTSAVVTDMDALADKVTEMGLLGVSGVITDMGILGTSAVVTDLDAVADKVTEIGRLGTSDAVADMAILGTSAIVTDMDLLATSANVTAMGHLGTSANVTAMGLLGTSAAVADMALLGTSDCVADMALLGTSDVVSDMNLLATSDIIADLNTLATSDIVTDMNLLATSANVTAMGLLGTSANVTAMGLLGVAGVITDMGILGTSDIVADMALLGTSDCVSDMNTLGTSDNVTNMNTVADNIAGVNSFAERYRVASSAPGSDLDEGDLYFNTTDNNLYFYNGSAWTQITTYTHPNHSGDVVSSGDGAMTIQDDAVDIAMLSATGTASSSTFLRGDNSWVAVTTDLVGDTSPQLGGFLDANGNYMQTEKGGDIASASPTVIDTDGDYFDVTGTTNFAAFTVAADRQFTLQFDGVLTMTHHATNLDLPGEANITTAAGDVATFQSTAANQVQCINYSRASGEPIVGAATATLGFFEHTNTISSNLTISTDYNALSAGPITVASGYSVTVPSGSTWVIA